MSIEKFILDELKDYTIYKELAKAENNKNTQKILNHLAEHEKKHYYFWLGFSTKKDFKVRALEVTMFKIIRRLLGLTFTLRLLERHEKDVIKRYKSYLKKMKGADKKKLERIIYEEEFHEKSIVNQIKEERVEFTGSIILGLNDALIELTAALAGLTSVLQNNLLIGFSGLIAGIAAAMSMASSSYLQAKQENNRSPKKSAFYTGISYILVVMLLISPFFIIPKTLLALALTVVIAIVVVSFTATYTAILFNRSLKKEIAEMLFLSLGIAAIVFIIGNAVKIFINI